MTKDTEYTGNFEAPKEDRCNYCIHGSKDWAATPCNTCTEYEKMVKGGK